MTRPRIRSLKPDTWADEKVRGVSRDARLLFVVLITMADDDGRLRDLPVAILGHGYPEDRDAPRRLERWLEELRSAGLIARYEVEGKHYIVLPKWARHQRVSHYRASVLPAPVSRNGHPVVMESEAVFP